MKAHGKLITNILVVLLVVLAVYTKLQENGMDSLFKLTDLYILAGGITPANTGEAIRKLHPFCLDASSGLETDGKKDPVKMAEMKRRAEEAMTEGTEVTEGTAEEMHTEETAGEHQ